VHLAQLQPRMVGDEETVEIRAERDAPRAVLVLEGERRVTRGLELHALPGDLEDLGAGRERDHGAGGIVGVGDLRLVVVQVAAQVERVADAWIRDGSRTRAAAAGDERGREHTEAEQAGASHATRLPK